MNEDEDFFRDNPEDVVLREQPAIAVYTNVGDAVVIRQEQQEYDDRDQVVMVQPCNVVAVCRAMLRQVGLEHMLDGRERPMLALPAPAKDPTAAERMRRYRERHRNGVTRDVTGAAPALQFEMED